MERRPDDVDDAGRINDNFVITEDEKEVKKASLPSESTEEGPQRPEWGKSIEFLMSCVALSVGLGNVWRFPFTAYENGGGAFLIPYVTVLILIGKPMYFMEMILGQFTSRGVLRVWEMAPILKGIGIGQLVCTAAVLSYYLSLISLSLNYLFASFSSELPWVKCLASWGENCVDSSTTSRIARTFSISKNANQSVSSSELYFLREVLKEKDDISTGLGSPNVKLTLCLLLAWTIVFIVIAKGIKSSGKVSYFLAVFPYVVMITILVRGVTLDGSIDGILFFLKPKWGDILSPKVWYAATTQVFYSLSVGTGAIPMFASYNRFDHNIRRDCLIITTLDTFTSMLAGMTIFSILGNLAFNLGVEDIGNVVKAGSSLAFISYPDAIAKFDVWPQFFAVLFFFMLTVLGIGSAVALLSAITTVISDEFPTVKYWKIAAAATSVGFLLGICYVTPGGQWMLNLIDHFGGTFLVFAMAILEMLAIFYVYGIENFCDDIEFMLKWKPTAFWRVSWRFVTPGIMIAIFIYYMSILEAPTYGGWVYPTGYMAFGWIVFALGFLQLPFWIVWFLIRKRKLPLSDRVREGASPSANWGPKNPDEYTAWALHKTQAQKKRVDAAANQSRSIFAKIWLALQASLGRNRSDRV